MSGLQKVICGKWLFLPHYGRLRLFMTTCNIFGILTWFLGDFYWLLFQKMKFLFFFFTQAMESIQVGDLDSSQMKILVDFLTSQACCDEQKTFDSILNLSKHIKSGNEKPFRYVLTFCFSFCIYVCIMQLNSGLSYLIWDILLKIAIEKFY